MEKRAGLVASIVGASLFVGIADAYAAPSSVFIEGTTSVYTDYFTGSDVAGNAGQPFSIVVKLDLANGTLSSSPAPENSFANRSSVRGCRFIEGGTCVLDFGAQLPVVTDYSIATSFAPVGGYLPIPTVDYLWDSTTRLNQSVTGEAPMDVYSIERSQGQCTFIAGDPDLYAQSCVERIFYVYLTTSVNTMFGSLANLMDLNRTPNLGDVPPGYVGFTYMNFLRTDVCEPALQPACVPVDYQDGSVAWSGTLTSVVAVGGGGGGAGPTTKEACKKDGWKAFGFKNQGQCVSYVNHLP